MLLLISIITVSISLNVYLLLTRKTKEKIVYTDYVMVLDHRKDSEVPKLLEATKKIKTKEILN